MKGLRAKDSLLTGTILSRCILLAVVILIGACQNPQKEKLHSGESFGKIIYDASILNRDSTDSWANECLSEFNRKALIEKIFNAVYDGRITPLDYFTNEKISPEKIKRMETAGEFSRENISKMRFEEKWIWDEEKAEMQKQLISITISYDVFDNTGKTRGQKPIFKIVYK